MTARDIGRVCLVAALVAIPRHVLAQTMPAHAENEIGGIGQIVPAGGIVAVAGEAGFVVRSIAVQPGDKVARGDLLLVSENSVLQAEETIAAQDLKDQKQLADARVAVETLVARLEEERLKRAERELAAYTKLGANATAENETLRLEENVADARLTSALEDGKLQEARVEGVASVNGAALRLELAKQKSAMGELRAPIAGTVLAVASHVGDRLAGEAALKIADLDTLYVTCQVFEGDLPKIAKGLKATIRNPALTKPLNGVVERVGRLIDTKARLGDVTIKLDAPENADRLIDMEVEVLIARAP
jgi:membrane fusion protein, macrolide-specific efflux system